MDFYTVPDGREVGEFRREMAAKYKARVLDMLLPQWVCSRCSAAVPTESLIVPAVRYRTIEEAVAFFTQLLNELASKAMGVSNVPGQELAVQISVPHGRPMACPACGGAPTLTGAEAVLYSSTLGGDMVVRITPNAAPQLLGAGAPLAWTQELQAGFLRDAIVRSLAIAREEEDVEAGVNLIAEAAQSVPGEPDVLSFLPWLNNQRQSSAVLAMAEATMQRFPQRADGWFWKAQVLTQQSAELQRPALANEAEQLLAHALQIEPGHGDAAVALANVARIRRNDAEARSILDRLLQHDPTHAVANYTVGLILLPNDPAGALAYFERGERSAPDDPDYPRARAQALAALGRTPEAQAAIAHALELAPDDPRAQQVASQLAAQHAGANPIARMIKLFVGAILLGVLLFVVAILAYVLHTMGVF